jgi:hypothetical protein
VGKSGAGAAFEMIGWRGRRLHLQLPHVVRAGDATRIYMQQSERADGDEKTER